MEQTVTNPGRIANPLKWDGLASILRGLGTKALGGWLIYADLEALLNAPDGAVLVTALGGLILLGWGGNALARGIAHSLPIKLRDLTFANAQESFGQDVFDMLFERNLSPSHRQPANLFERILAGAVHGYDHLPDVYRYFTIRSLQALFISLGLVLFLALTYVTLRAVALSQYNDFVFSWVALLTLFALVLTWRRARASTQVRGSYSFPGMGIGRIVFLALLIGAASVGLSQVMSGVEDPGVDPAILSAPPTFLWFIVTLIIGAITTVVTVLVLALPAAAFDTDLSHSRLRDQRGHRAHPDQIIIGLRNYLDRFPPNYPMTDETVQMRSAGAGGQGAFNALVRREYGFQQADMPGLNRGRLIAVVATLVGHASLLAAAYFFAQALSVFFATGLPDFDAPSTVAPVLTAWLAALMPYLLALIAGRQLVSVGILRLAQLPVVSQLLETSIEGTVATSNMAMGQAVQDSFSDATVTYVTNYTLFLRSAQLHSVLLATQSAGGAKASRRFFVEAQANDVHTTELVGAIDAHVSDQKAFTQFGGANDADAVADMANLNLQYQDARRNKQTNLPGTDGGPDQLKPPT